MKKRFFLKHRKSSALMVSLAIHVLFIVGALSFVAVTVIQKNEVGFESKEINRPKMNLRKLQVPVNVKKPARQPKLRKQIVVKQDLAKISPEIKMPEIVGVKGGFGGGGGGFGAGASLGFSMPEINFFGVKSKGEKIFILLESSEAMMLDEMGGIPAYTLIKQEVVKMLDGLPPTALFNIIVYDTSRAGMRFPGMVPASAENVQHVKEWLNPLNAVKPDMGSKEYGLKTLGKGGTSMNEDFLIGKIEKGRDWYPPTAQAMVQQADAIFLLCHSWGAQWHAVNSVDVDKWYQTSAGKRWLEAYEKGKKLLEEENRKRAEEGRPPRVLPDSPWAINRAYFPNLTGPPKSKEKYWYTVPDFIEAFLEIRNQFRPVDMMNKLGIERNTSSSKIDFSLNVIHFLPRNADRQQDERFMGLADTCDGEYRTLAGLEAIQSSIAIEE